MRVRKSKDWFLTALIKKQRKKLCKGVTFVQWFKDLVEQIYVPSWQSFISVIFILLPFFVLSHWSKFEINEQHKNLISVHSGIGIIIFALIIFVAESLREDETKDKARVLLKESLIFPLVVSEILIFFNLGWGNVNIFGVLPVVFIGIFALISLSRLVSVLLNKFDFFQKRLQLLKDRLKRSINLAIDERFGNNIFLSRLGEGKIELEYRPFMWKMGNIEFHCFSTTKRGIVSEINLNKLNEFAKTAEEEANNKGYSFYKDKARPMSILETGNENLILGREPEKYVESKTCYILKKYKDQITEKNKDLLCVDKRIVRDPEIVKKLEKLVKQIFVIRSGDNFSEQTRLDLASIKDQFIDAINNGNLGKISDSIKIYTSLAEAFLELLKECGGGYTFEQARQERGTMLNGWNEIKWIKKDILDIFKKGMKSHDKDIIASVGYLPIAIAKRAINFRDHYLFQEFIGFTEYLYIESQSEIDTKLKSFMIDRSWRYLQETADFYVEFELTKKELREEELLSLKSFAVYFLIVFQNLLKEAYQNNDLESFKQFKKHANRLFDHFQPSKEYPTAKELEWQLDNIKPSTNQNKKLKTQMEKKKLLEETEKEIKNRRKQMFFGLTSWILEQFRKEPENDGIKNFYFDTEGTLPNTLKELTEIFLSAHTFETEHFWGWHWWGIIPNGKVHSVDVLGKIERLYCIKALRILKNEPREKIEKIKLPYNRDLSFLVKDNGKLIRILNDIQNNRSNWKFILSDEEIANISCLKELLEKAKKKQEKAERECKKSTKISHKKVEEFKEQVIKGFKETVVLRNIFQSYKLYEDKTNERYKNELKRFGINIVDDKAAFFEEWHVHYGNWGIHYGQDLAFGEDSYIVGKIASYCKEIEERDFEKILEKFSNLSDIIVLATNVALHRFFKNSRNFKPKWHKDSPQLKVSGFEGWYTFQDQDIPTFEIRRKVDKQVMILNKSRLGKLTQYLPLNKGEREELRKGVFSINVQAFSENGKLMENFLEKPPEWLRKLGDKEKQRDHLEEKVLVNILERFEYNKAKDFEGYLLRMEE